MDIAWVLCMVTCEVGLSMKEDIDLVLPAKEWKLFV